jgi:hypothetical protein
MHVDARLVLDMTSNQIREYARKRYIEPAIARREQRISVRAGDVHKALALKNRVPAVCQALESRTFLQENDLILEAKEGPPSGQSTTVVFTYRIANNDKSVAPETKFSGLMQLYGVGKEAFAKLGGGENFLRAERRAFAEGIEKSDRKRGLL